MNVGERFVGQRAAEERAEERFRRDRWGATPVETYDDPDHLVQAHSDLMASIRDEKERRDALRRYITYWAGEKRRENDIHRKKRCWSRCPFCLNCTCGRAIRGGWTRCVCGEGQKLLAPYRRVWLNASIKRERLTTIWTVGVGDTPKQEERYSQSAVGLDV